MKMLYVPCNVPHVPIDDNNNSSIFSHPSFTKKSFILSSLEYSHKDLNFLSILYDVFMPK